MRIGRNNPKYKMLTYQNAKNLKLIEQHMRLGRTWDKQVAYFYDAPWKEEYLRDLATAEKCYQAGLYYWKEAKLWHECDKFLYNPLSKRSVDSFKTNEYSLLSIDTENIELGAFYTANGEYYLRAFNIGENTEAEFTIDKNKFSGILRVNPEGVVCGDALEEKNGKFIDTIPSFGIRTYKLIK